MVLRQTKASSKILSKALRKGSEPALFTLSICLPSLLALGPSLSDFILEFLATLLTRLLHADLVKDLPSA